MTMPRVDFASFVASIGAGAAAAMQQAEQLRSGGGEAHQDGEAAPSPQQIQEQVLGALGAARQLIDTLAMLEEKTKGNLSEAELEALRTTLTQLRVAYVKSATPGN